MEKFSSSTDAVMYNCKLVGLAAEPLSKTSDLTVTVAPEKGVNNLRSARKVLLLFTHCTFSFPAVHICDAAGKRRDAKTLFLL